MSQQQQQQQQQQQKLRNVVSIYLKYMESALAWCELHSRQYRDIFLPAYLTFVRSFDSVPAHLKGLEFEYFHNFKFRAITYLLSYELYAMRYDAYLKDLRCFFMYVREQCQLLLSVSG